MKTDELSRVGAWACLAFALGSVYASTALSCTPSTQAKVAKAEADLCQARAAYKLAAAATGGKLDAEAGSARANLEAAEDAFCQSLPAGGQ